METMFHIAGARMQDGGGEEALMSELTKIVRIRVGSGPNECSEVGSTCARER